MKISTANDKCNFGKHKGHTYAEIYKYEPSYIQWAIIHVSEFIIKISEFEALPTPTPYQHTIDFGNLKLSGLSNKSHVLLGKKQVAEGKEIAPISFTFGKELQNIIEQKLDGIYTPDKWEKQMYVPADIQDLYNFYNKEDKE